jgi:hypothetical protein
MRAGCSSIENRARQSSRIEKILKFVALYDAVTNERAEQVILAG